MSEPWQRREVIGAATLLLGDCLEILPALGAVDHVITDPPYSERTHAGHEAGVNGHIGAGKDSAERQSLGYAYLDAAAVAALAQAFAAASAGWIVWLSDHVLAPDIAAQLEQAGRYVFAPLPFVAPGSRVRLGGDGPSSWTIWITPARPAALSRWGTLPGAYIAGEGWREREYMGGKPIALMSRIVDDYSRRGDVVCDPCMGGGTTGVAAVQMGRAFVGIDCDADAFELSCRRIDAAQRQGRLFA